MNRGKLHGPALALVSGLAAIALAMVGRAAIADDTPAAAPAASAPSAPKLTRAAKIAYGTLDDAEGEEEADSHDRAPGAQPAPAASAAPAASGALAVPLPQLRVPEKDGMLRIPGGKLSYAAPLASPLAAKTAPQIRTTSVGPFWLDRTEVTVGDYKACVASGKCSRPAKHSASCTYDLGDASLPVSCVHWTDADAYCRVNGKRLPTEAEWEFAARGVTAAAFPWGNALSCKHANVMTGSFFATKACAKHPMPVGSHPAGVSVYGVHDLIGNVEEWTADWYADRSATVSPRVGAAHVLRGGGWLSEPQMAKTGARNWGSSMEAGPNVGFRCARADN